MCLPDESALLVDGANGVCDAPRSADAISGGWLLGTSFAALAVAGLIVALGSRRPGVALALTLALLATAAAPGLHAIVLERPSRAILASGVTGLHDRVRHHARDEGPVVAGNCSACEPVVRLATIDLPSREGTPLALRTEDLTRDQPAVPPGVVPLRPAAVLVLLSLVGAALFSLAGARATPGAALAWTTRAMTGAAILALALLHPVAGVLGMLAALAGALGTRDLRPAPARTSLLPLVALGVLIAIALARPAAPTYWDEFVWLSKARVAAHDPTSFARIALSPASPLIPRGYPIAAPLLAASFALLDDATTSLLAGQLAIPILAMTALVLSLARLDAVEARGRRLATTLLVLAATPMFWVHWQSAYLDLTTGLLAATLLVALRLDAMGDGIGRPLAVATSLLLVGLKDEGIAHALAVLVAHAATIGGRRSASILSLAAALLAWGALRAALLVHGGAPEDHAVSGLALGFLPSLARLVAAHAVDATSWGAAPWLALAAMLVSLRAAEPGLRATATALSLAALGLGAAVLLGPDRVREFARDGTLLGRLGVQLLPTAALLVASVLGPGAPRHVASRDDAATATQRALDAALAAPAPKARAEGLQGDAT